MHKIIRIGTRSSELALWQANLVAKQLKDKGYNSEIVEIDSKGDIVLDKPLYRLGVVGVFTRNLDIAMLKGEIDVAVHSLKDVPTDLPEGIVQAAVLERANYHDILVFKNDIDFLNEENAILATGSLRRKAQWLDKYPTHTVVDLRGNVNTRLQKLQDNFWNGAIFAAAGLERINLLPKNHIVLDWMLPAPAQGAIMITALEKDAGILQICAQLNHQNTAIAVNMEREFLNTMEGGCTAPIAALAIIEKDVVIFRGALFSLDGSHKLEFLERIQLNEIKDTGKICAEKMLENGGAKMMAAIKMEMNK
ncbi:MAG: hydroxymethylbilane synthase [Flavobacteriaceae bacterium]|nr:hydroxymethylbilane synthase [Flavobacteriaceae bacterium]